MKVVAIIQARMGSSRLPGKVLKIILGKPMLWHMVRRLQDAECVHDVVIATTVNKEDEKLEKFAVENNLKVYRGSENDIVDRFFNAAKENDADIVIRVCGDCALIDPAIIDEVMREFIEGDYDYANNFNPPTYPVGMNFDIYTFNTFKKIWNGATDKFYREYPYEYIYANSSSFRTLFKRYTKDFSEINLSVDYIQDFNLVTKIYQDLYREDGVFHLEDILKSIGDNPSLREINRGLPRDFEYTRDKKLRGDL